MTNDLLAAFASLASLRGMGHGLLGRLIDLTLASGFLLGGALLLNRLFERRISASLRLLLFLAVFARVFVPLALPASWHSPLGLFGRAPVAAGAGAVAREAPLVVSLGRTPGSPAFNPELLGMGAIYGVGLLVLLGRWGYARLRLQRQLGNARLTGGAWYALCGVPVLEHATLGPLVAGVRRPRIVLPAALLATAAAPDLALVLAHEAAHVRRRDHLLVPLVQLLTIVAWPILPLWLAARQVRGLVELACDERVLAGRGREQRRRYGELLLALSSGQLIPSPVAPSFGWELRTRFRALKRARRWRTGAQVALVGVCGAMLLACSGPPAPEDPPSAPPVSPAPAAQEAEDENDPPPATVRGSLDKDIIREVIRSSIPKVKACYEEGLARTPSMGGRALASFTIAATGKVVESSIESSTLGDAAVDACIARVMRGQVFPKPDGGGIVMVKYPFTFASDE